uniref:NADH dehydrogenase subunit 6 n=1 Tax=Tullbergia mixta TaxID=1499077 RepID=A0A7T6Y6Z9_9HEXA|nr:NADH dehydrogenase subunit 6 [Tullbergia mixta]QQK54728.1 NADH dehydrogenase subunit 6 [Tullbergia mixta]
MKLFLLVSISLSTLAVTISHPIALVFIILAQTSTVCLASFLIHQTSWFSFVIFLIFFGGIMVLFVYISSLASNENFAVSFKSTLYTTTTLAGMTLVVINMNTPISQSNELNFLNFTLKMYSTQMTPITALTMLYLLLSLFVVVEIIKQYQAPLRASS